MPGAKNPNSFVIKWERSIKHSLEKCKLVFRRAVAKGKKCNNFVPTKVKFMDVSIIAIGNSKGIRLSKALLEKYNITDKVELILEKGYIILKPKTVPRDGWENAFKKMHENGDDNLLIDDVFEDENLEEWS
jgi:antitoxin MazE